MKKILIPLTIALLIAIGIGAFIYNSPDHRISRSMNLAKSLFDEGQWEEAKVELNKIIEIDATNLDAHIMLADVYKNLNDTENQIAVYEKIIEIAPDREETYLDYAEIYIAKEDWQKAREILQLGVDNTSGQKVKDRLTEIEKIIADIEEAERIAQEEARKVKLQPLVNCLDDVWGRNWMEWTVEDYINEYHAEKFQIEKKRYNKNFDFIIGFRYVCFDDDHYCVGLRETAIVGDNWASDYVLDFYKDGSIRYIVYLKSEDKESTLPNNIISFCKEYKLNNIEGCKQYLKIDKLPNNNETYRLLTDMGNAVLQYCIDEHFIEISNIDQYPGLRIRFTFKSTASYFSFYYAEDYSNALCYIQKPQ